MSLSDSFLPISKPSCSGHLSASQILLGMSISPINRVRIMDDKDYEDFIGEWLYGCLKEEYFEIFHIGGSGDGGRDLAAYVDPEGNQWDNYQCKHYKNPLSPRDILLEIGKLSYYCFNRRYKWPRNYFFVSIEISPSSLDLLKNPDKLKGELISRWEKTCEKNITASIRIKLTPEIRSFINQCDFSIFHSITAEKIIDQHSKTVYYAPRFGGGLRLKPREDPIVSPIIAENEQTYITKLYDAYSEDENIQISSTVDFKKNLPLLHHFNRQREYYYSAEMLKQFSRDNLPPESTSFEDLKQDIYDSIIPIVENNHPSCRCKIDKTLLMASKIPIDVNALKDTIRVRDKQGLCHHLASECDDIKWTRK